MLVFTALKGTVGFVPKGISLKVRRDPSRPSPWYVNVPGSLSQTGKRSRLYFATRALAQGAAERLKTRRDNFGVSLGNLTSAQVVEAADCYEQLAGYKVTLSDAVRGYLEVLQSRSGSSPLGELFEKFLQAKAHKSGPYLDALRWTRKHFEPLAATLACDVTVRDLEAILEPLKPSVKDAFRRYIRAVLNFGVRLDYLTSNPAVKLEASNPVKAETEIFTPAEVQQLLEHTLRSDLELLPYRVLAFYCGIRPMGELNRLKWENVSLTDRVVTLPAAITKSKRKRFVELSPNSLSWLEAYRQRGGRCHGPIAPHLGTKALYQKLCTNYRSAGLLKWIPQGARHSFCSYWLAMHHNDVDKLVILSGHDSKATLWRHYYRATTRIEAEKFWSITPENAG